MKKAFLTLAVTFFALGISFAQDGFTVKYEEPSQGVRQLEFTLGDYRVTPVELGGVLFSQVGFEGRIVTTKKGFAELPYIHASVMIDPTRNVRLTVIPGEYEEIILDRPLVPSRGIIYRSEDPSAIPYVIDPKSLVDDWYPEQLAEATDPYILRDIRGVNVYVFPFSYNAVQNTLRVYKEVTVILTEEQETVPVNPLETAPQAILREMDAIYRDVFINYDAVASRDDLTIGEIGDILVITTDRDEDAIQPYIDWKTEKGYFVEKLVVTAGTNVNNLVKDAYLANNDLLYVLLVGDWADIKCNTLSSGSPMDPQVGCVVGTDTYPDISVGRFSANSPADVTTQVNKVISYEKLPETGGAWYSSATGIASAEGAGIGDDGEADIAHNDVIWDDKLDPFTFNTFTDIYDPGASAGEVTAIVNAGTSIINYTGHGSAQSWGTTGFSNSHVGNLSNGDRMPWLVSVACNNGDFHTGTCFAEAWMRKSGGGAIMFMGASISQPWDPPMRGQDYFMDILIGGYDYSQHPGQSGINTTEQRTTFGSVIFNGLVLMCVESGGSSDWETAKTWNLFGDPATQARTAAPADLTLSSTLVMVGLPFTTTVTSGSGPVANAIVALSQGGDMYRGITDATGSVSFEHIFQPGTAKLVVTAFNTETIYEDVSVVPASGPYVLFSSFEVSDAGGNGNGLLDYAETVYLTVGLANVGTEEATNVQATLSTADAFLGILDNTADFGNIPAGDTVYITDAFHVSASDSIPDGHTVIFMIDAIGDGSNTWTSSFGTQAHAPELRFLSYSIDDSQGNGNGRLDPGETAVISLAVANLGSSASFDVNGALISASPSVEVSGSPAPYGDLIPGDTSEQQYQVVVSSATPAGEMASFDVDVLAMYNITAQGGFDLCIGQIPVLVLDFDNSNSSAPDILQSLANLEVGSENLDAFPANLALYTSVFVCLGTYPDNHVLTAEEGQVLADYLMAGGRIYMEGADTWYYDQQFTPTPVHAMFGLRGESDGSGDLSSLQGPEGSITEGMVFSYSGDNSYIDHLLADGGVMMFENTEPAYGAAVSYDAGIYRTIGTSMEFGGIVDGDQTRDDLMIRILDFFGVPGIWTSVSEPQPDRNLDLCVSPNPVDATATIRFTLDKDAQTSLDLIDLNGKVVMQLSDGKLIKGNHEILWNSDGLMSGVYLLRLNSDGNTSNLKILVR